MCELSHRGESRNAMILGTRIRFERGINPFVSFKPLPYLTLSRGASRCSLFGCSLFHLSLSLSVPKMGRRRRVLLVVFGSRAGQPRLSFPCSLLAPKPRCANQSVRLPSFCLMPRRRRAEKQAKCCWNFGDAKQKEARRSPKSADKGSSQPCSPERQASWPGGRRPRQPPPPPPAGPLPRRRLRPSRDDSANRPSSSNRQFI